MLISMFTCFSVICYRSPDVLKVSFRKEELLQAEMEDANSQSEPKQELNSL
jgi:hypothetical protein